MSYKHIPAAQEDPQPKLKRICPDCGCDYEPTFPPSGDDLYRGRVVRDMTRDELIAALKEMGRLYAEALTAPRI